ncbi:hypothetical protein [Longimicrobium sp.]|jgi:hypothetical protein|uniref:hypothetical protein n=1 Tax=Longimicrobium sp. TaxID=2029185 RepID=UPI002EDB3A7E
MLIPPAENFRSESGSDIPMRCWASLPEMGYDLGVPVGVEWEPEARSLALAETVLPSIDSILDEAVGHVRKYADVQRLGIVSSRPELLCVFCDAARERVELSFFWEVQLYIHWTVAFHWSGTGARTPLELSIRPR